MVDIVNVNDIKSVNWSPTLETEGQIVENIADIEQCFFNILSTTQGQDPHRPTFASNILDYLDRPQPVAVPLLIRDITDSILKWEPRVDIIRVTVDYLTDEIERIEATIQWTLKNTTFEQTTTVRL